MKIVKETGDNSVAMSGGVYHVNGVPAAYTAMAEEVQKGREAKIAHLLAQVNMDVFYRNFGKMSTLIILHTDNYCTHINICLKCYLKTSLWHTVPTFTNKGLQE